MHVVRQPSLYFLKGYFARLMCAEECEVRVDLRLERLSLMLQQARREGVAAVLCFHGTSLENTRAVFERGAFDPGKGKDYGYGFRTTFFAVDPRVANYYAQTAPFDQGRRSPESQLLVCVALLRAGEYALRGCTGGTLTMRSEHLGRSVVPIGVVRYPSVTRTMAGVSRWGVEQHLDGLIDRMEEELVVLTRPRATAAGGEREVCTGGSVRKGMEGEEEEEEEGRDGDEGESSSGQHHVFDLHALSFRQHNRKRRRGGGSLVSTDS